MSEIVTKPKAKDIRAACERFDHDYPNVDAVLQRLFDQYPKNKQKADVLLKVAAVNALYSTRMLLLGTRHVTLLEVVDHIVREKDIDRELAKGAPEVVGLIAHIEVDGTNGANNKKNNRYSFATKYCSWHNSESYPIFDSQVEAYLWSLINKGCLEKRSKKELKEYSTLKDIVCEFREKNGLEKTSFKKIDKFMFYEGKKMLDDKKKASKKKALLAADTFPSAKSKR